MPILCSGSFIVMPPDDFSMINAERFLSVWPFSSTLAKTLMHPEHRSRGVPAFSPESSPLTVPPSTSGMRATNLRAWLRTGVSGPLPRRRPAHEMGKGPESLSLDPIDAGETQSMQDKKDGGLRICSAVHSPMHGAPARHSMAMECLADDNCGNLMLLGIGV